MDAAEVQHPDRCRHDPQLYEASQAGVNVTLIVREAVLRAGVKGLSDNIEAYSVVAALEHARVVVFGAGGKPSTSRAPIG